jgi:hypothetical protein
MARIDNRGNFRGSLQNSAGSPDSASVKGTEDFIALSKALKQAGATQLRKELHKAVQAAAKPLIPQVRAAAEASLPKHGGLNRRIAKKPYRTQARTGAKTAGVRIVGAQVDPRINSQGRIQHPVFGRKGSTVVQFVPEAKGYFDDTLSRGAAPTREAIAQALSDFADRIIRERG